MKYQRKNILFIGQLPPPLHGASVMNSHVLNSDLLKSSFDFSVVNLNFGTSIHELGKFSFRKLFKAIQFGFDIVRAIIAHKPDLVYYNLTPFGFALYRDAFYVFLVKLFKKKIVFHLHTKGIRDSSRKSGLKKILFRRVFRNTHIICLSKLLTYDIEEVYDMTPFIVPNGIKIQQNNNIQKKATDSVPNILYLSHYFRSKGVLVLIEALAILKNQGYQFKARFVGTPGDLTINFLQEEIANRKLTESITISGPLYENEKFLEFQKADIFVFPTYNDVFGLVNLEAMQYRLPVISTFEGSIPEVVVDNETGFLVEPRNPGMLAEKIAILLKDNELREKMGIKGYDKFINNYTLQHFEERMNVVFNTILE